MLPSSQEINTDDHVKGSGLAGAIRPEQPDHLAAADLERNLLTTPLDLKRLLRSRAASRLMARFRRAWCGVMRSATRHGAGPLFCPGPADRSSSEPGRPFRNPP